MWSTCLISLATPASLFLSLRGLWVDRTRWYALGGALLSAPLAGLMALSLVVA